MADSKITALTAISTVDPTADPLVIVDVSDTSMAASGTTKKSTINQLLGAGGTATLASATITGALTVDTTTLVVNPAGYPDRVGIGTASPAAELHVVGGANFSDGVTTLRAVSAGNVAYLGTTTTDPLVLRVNNIEQYRIAQLGVFNWSDGAGGTRMTLNATGLGVGVAPSAGKFEVQESGTGSGIGSIFTSTVSGGGNPGVVFRTASTNRWSLSLTGSAGAESIRFYDANNSATRLVIDSSGNVGIGVTPITSHILSCSGPVGITGTLAGSRTSYITNASAASIYYTDGGGSGYFTDFGNLIIQPRTSAARSVVIATGSTTPVERAVVKSTGQVRFVPLAADPAGAEAGDVYYNSTSNKLKCYNGTTWNDLF